MLVEISNSIDVQCDVLYPEFRLTRRWLSLERQVRVAYQTALNSKPATAYKALSQSHELPVLRHSPLSRPWLVHPPLCLAVTRPITRFRSRSRRGAQRRECCASIRDPGERCGPDPRFNQPIATAMHFVPARRPLARPCDCAQDESGRLDPGSLVQ